MKTSYCKPNNPNQGGSKKQYGTGRRKLFTDPPVRIEYQAEDANSSFRPREKIKVKEYVDPADTNNNTKFDIDIEREDPKMAEEFCRFAMRVTKHLKDARLDQSSSASQARRVAMFLNGTALRKWENEVAKVMTNANATFQDIMNAFALRYMPPDAAKEQTDYIKPDLVKPYKMKPSEFISRMEDINLYIDFMPDTKSPRRTKLSDDEIKGIYVNAMPVFMKEQCRATHFITDDKSVVELGVHFDYLDGVSKRDAGEQGPQGRKGNKDKPVPTKTDDKSGDAKKTGDVDNKSSGSRSSKFCSYCKKQGHSKDECRKLKRKRASDQGTETQTESQHMQEFVCDLHVQDSEEEANLDDVLEALDKSTAEGDESTLYIL